MEPKQEPLSENNQIDPNISPKTDIVKILPSDKPQPIDAIESFNEPKNGLMPYIAVSIVIIIAGIAIGLVTIFGN